jgi:hypothetical protein
MYWMIVYVYPNGVEMIIEDHLTEEYACGSADAGNYDKSRDFDLKGYFEARPM